MNQLSACREKAYPEASGVEGGETCAVRVPGLRPDFVFGQAHGGGGLVQPVGRQLRSQQGLLEFAQDVGDVGVGAGGVAVLDNVAAAVGGLEDIVR